MALQNTNLLIQGSQLPITFKGTPNELFQAMLARMRIVSPSGRNFFVIGDIEPSSNVGPWLKGGTQWWVFDEATKRYAPLDITQSEVHWYQVGSTTPTTTEPPVWLKTTGDATQDTPQFGTPISWNLYDGTTWVDFTSLKDGSVTLDKVADGTPASLLTFDDDNRPILIPHGSAGELLKITPDGNHLAWGTIPPESIVGQLAGQLLGPLTTGYDPLTESVTVSLTENREVFIQVYVNALVNNGQAGTIILTVDGIQRDSWGATIGGSVGGVTAVLMSRQTLVTGAHTLAVTVSSLPFGNIIDPVDNGGTPTVKFTVNLL